MHGASTAHRHATAEFGAGQPELVADDPEQRRVLGNVEITFLAIDLKLHHVSHSLFSGGFQWWTSPCVQEAEATRDRSEEHTSELQSLMRISYAVFCLKKKKH